MSSRLDVQKRAEVETAIEDLPVEWGDIDVLVNNAGLSRGLTKVYEDDPQNWEEMIDTNVKGLLYVTRSVVPGMVARGRGHVINLGSTAGYIAYANGAVYCATKAAEKSISEGLKIDLMGTAVRVTSVDAGWWRRISARCVFAETKSERQRCTRTLRRCKPEDVADAIVWAASRPATSNIHTVVMTTIDQANSTSFTVMADRAWKAQPGLEVDRPAQLGELLFDIGEREGQRRPPVRTRGPLGQNAFALQLERLPLAFVFCRFGVIVRSDGFGAAA